MPKLTSLEGQPEPILSEIVALQDLSARGQSKAGKHVFDISPTVEERARIAADLGILKLRKVRLQGVLSSVDKSDWQLVSKLGATVEQACVVTNEPVVTRIDIDISRLYLAEFQDEPVSSENEFNGRDDVEALDSQVDLGALLIESLALNLPDYPRAPGAELEESQFSPPGTKPIDETETKPFASLAALRDKFDK
ncbi:MAG: uncharacterized metal-binding protein YceD (DUF177 family) [Paracoccaceae bacterium]|jgi:uncharacterized metal-binding protein YceD (DUF177 family)